MTILNLPPNAEYWIVNPVRLTDPSVSKYTKAVLPVDVILPGRALPPCDVIIGALALLPS